MPWGCPFPALTFPIWFCHSPCLHPGPAFPGLQQRRGRPAPSQHVGTTPSLFPDPSHPCVGAVDSVSSPPPAGCLLTRLKHRDGRLLPRAVCCMLCSLCPLLCPGELSSPHAGLPNPPPKGPDVGLEMGIRSLLGFILLQAGNGWAARVCDFSSIISIGEKEKRKGGGRAFLIYAPNLN